MPTTPEINFHDQTTWILGYFKPDQLTHYPYSTWYVKGIDDYQIKTEALNKLLEINKDDLSIKIIMGVLVPRQQERSSAIYAGYGCLALSG